MGGLPVATATRVVTDLLADREDESAVARVIQDALREGLLRRDELEDLVEGAAAAYGASSAPALAAALAGPTSATLSVWV